KELVKKLGFTLIEREITPAELYGADEAFLSGTAAEIMPVREVNKRTIGSGRMGPVTRKLLEEFNKIVRDPKEGTPIW
ncbi:MAG: aminotransferase class IV, partial [Candidatus Bathyarchaeota archaeon]|nr:aminotransferase class IV [Candidatus Bathyarchaeota archaeon]